MSVLDRKIGEIVDENYIYGRALKYLGIEFYEFEHHTLGALCSDRGISKSRLIRSFYQFDSTSRIPISEIQSYPLKLTLEYLRFAHHTYIKDFLPYIANLISKIPDRCENTKDLKAVFPLFVEDFIKHVYEEEDKLFQYINHLLQTRKDKKFHHFAHQSAFSLKEMRDHHLDEDEMEGIRNLLSEIKVEDLITGVVIKEIKAFDREILYHAQIENEILFPEAIKLEREILTKVSELVRLN